MNIVQPAYPPLNGEPAYRDLSVVVDEIIHHSAGPTTQTVLDIDAFHRARGYVMIGYTLIIGADGTVYQGRPLEMVPAAAQGFNTISVDICLIGNFQPDDPGYTGMPTAAQIQSLKDASVYVHQKCPNIERTLGHRDLMSDACPGDLLYALIPSIRAYVAGKLHL
jgi:N-acetylmuramoyl-L-alanine amidase